MPSGPLTTSGPRGVRRLALLAALASLPVPRGEAAPRARAELGFEGIQRGGRPVSVRLAIDNEGPGWSGIYRVEERAGDREGLAWELPLEIAEGARTVRWLTITPTLDGPSVRGGLELSGGWVGAESRQPLFVEPLGFSADVFVALSINDRESFHSVVREVLDPQGNNRVRLPSVPPEELPPDPAAWEVVDLIVIDLGAADRIDGAAWRAIATRVSEGASLVVDGSGPPPELLPEALRAGGGAAGASPRPWQDPASGLMHSALLYDPAPGAERVRVNGVELAWAVTRRVGAGRSTLAGVDLRNLQSSLEEQAPLWAALIGLSRPGQVGSVRPPDRIVPAVLRHAAARSVFPPAVFSLVLAFGSASAFACLFAVRRLARGRRLALLAPSLCAAAALPLFVTGGLSRLVEDRRPFVVVEHAAALGRTRTTWAIEPPDTSSRLPRLDLPGWPVRVVQRPGPPATGTLRFGRPSLALGLRTSTGAGLRLEAESWEEAPAPFRIERDGKGRALLRNLSGRDLEEVHVLVGRRTARLGDLAEGEARPWPVAGIGVAGSAPMLALSGYEGRLEGSAVAGLVRSGDGGLLVRPSDGLVVACLEERP